MKDTVEKESDADMESAKKQINVDILKMQNDGIQVLKIDRRGRLRHIQLKLVNGGRSISWASKFLGSKLGSRNKVDDSHILRIAIGQTTPAFEIFNKKDSESKAKSMSIFYTCSSGDRSLDLLIHNQDDFRCVNKVLTSMIDKLKKDKENLTADELFLREMWLRADDNGDGSLNEDEIYGLMASMNINMNRSAVRKLFRAFDIDCSSALELEEFKLLLDELQKRPALEDIWTQFAAGQFQRGIFLKQMSSRDGKSPRSPKASSKHHSNSNSKSNTSKPITTETYSIKSSISAQQYLEFWMEHQGEHLKETDLLTQLQSNLHGITLNMSPEDLKISYAMWMQIITHPSNDIFDPSKARLHQNMTFPLTYYYIASSHNTYLEGDQITSFSSVNRYVSDLLSGCRCVELDCWNGDNGAPVIYHGHTLTSKILFQDVIDAVKQNAFVTSPYPVILSIENHCDITQQIKLAEIMKSTLGDLLYIPPDLATLSAPGGMFPSPEELKYKILIKGKRAEKLEYIIAQDEEDGSNMKATKSPSFLNRVIGRTASSKKLTSGKSDEKISSDNKGASSPLSGKLNTSNSEVLSNPINLIEFPTLTKPPSLMMRQDSQKSLDDTHDENDGEGGAVAPELSEITTLCGSKVKVFGTYEDTMAAPWGICTSYNESRVAKYFKNYIDYGHWVLYNHKHFSRIYPTGTRIDSSNYEIGEALAAGAQLIALNYQTHDTIMHFYRGKFRENGNCGYVLKPEFLISYPFKLPSPPVTLHITIISAHQLPKARKKVRQIVDPFVVVQVTGVSCDVSRWHTRTINDNGFNPTYNESKSLLIRNPDAAIISFTVQDEDIPLVSAEFIAYASMPVSCMRRGLRTCGLYDEEGRMDGDYAFASILLYVDIEPFRG